MGRLVAGVATPYATFSRIALEREDGPQPRARPRFDVRTFGASGNGTTDDKRAFWSAIDAAAKVGGVVVVPGGTYRLTQTLRVPSGVAIEGAAAASTLQFDGDPIGIWGTSVHSVEIRNLVLTGAFAHGVLFQQSSSASIIGCHVAGATRARYNYAAAVFFMQSHDMLVERCRFDSNGLGTGRISSDIQCDGSVGYRSHHIRIVDNDCSSTNVTTNIRLYDVSQAEVRGNRISGARVMRKENSGYGISIYQSVGNDGSCTENTVADNTIAQTEGSGIYFNQSHRSRITGNTIHDVATVEEDGSLPVAGVALNQCEHVEISNNHLQRTGRAGIAIASNRSLGSIDVIHNDIAVSGGFGVHLRGLLHDVVVRDNTITETTGGIGSTLPFAQDAVEIVGNVISRTRVAPAITLRSATRATVKDNILVDGDTTDIDVVFHDATSQAAGNVRRRARTPGADVAAVTHIIRP